MKSVNVRIVMFVGVAALGWAAVQKVAATVVDLTVNNSGTINGAEYIFDKLQPTGTGVLNSFVRIQHNGTEQGYNTDGNPLPFDEKNGIWTHDLKFSALEESPDGHYLFVLDIAEGGEYPKSLLSLDGLKLYKSTIGGQNDNTVDANGDASGIVGTLLYNMDGIEDSHVLLDANRDGQPGNGVSDMVFKVPASVFAGVSASDYIILWSRFGLQAGAQSDPVDGSGSNDSFEEWANLTGFDQQPPNPPGPHFDPTATPEPVSGLLTLMSLASLSGLAARRRRAV